MNGDLKFAFCIFQFSMSLLTSDLVATALGTDTPSSRRTPNLAAPQALMYHRLISKEEHQ